MTWVSDTTGTFLTPKSDYLYNTVLFRWKRMKNRAKILRKILTRSLSSPATRNKNKRNKNINRKRKFLLRKQLHRRRGLRLRRYADFLSSNQSLIFMFQRWKIHGQSLWVWEWCWALWGDAYVKHIFPMADNGYRTSAIANITRRFNRCKSLLIKNSKMCFAVHVSPPRLPCPSYKMVVATKRAVVMFKSCTAQTALDALGRTRLLNASL